MAGVRVVAAAVGVAGVLSVFATACGTRQAGCGPTAAAPVPQEWTVDGTITSVATHCGTIFVGGSFGWIGRSTGAAALVDRSGGRRLPFPRFNGEVDAVVSDRRGGWFVGGSFADVDGRPCHALAHVRHGSVDWCAARIAEVQQLAAGGGRLYVSAGPSAAFSCCGRLIAFDLRKPRAPEWQLSLPPRELCRVSGNCGDVSRVDALTARRRTVYAGGVFDSVGGKSSRDLVAVDGASGRVHDWNAGVTNDRRLIPSDTEIGSLALAGDTLFVGGSFTRIGGAARQGIASISASTARATSWHPRLRFRLNGPDNGDPWVFGLVPSSSRVFVAGYFDAGSGFVALDPASARPLRWRTSLRFGQSEVFPVSLAGGMLYVAGRTAVDGERAFVAAVEARTGRATRWKPKTNGYVYSVAAAGNDVLVGGSFSSVNTLRRAGLAAIDAARARLLPWHPVLRTEDLPPVRSLLATDRTLYVGGAFFNVDGSRRRGLAAFELPSLQLDPWQPRLDNDSFSDAKALALVGDTLSVGGTFKALNGRPRQAFGAVSTKSGSTVGAASFSDEYSGFIVRLHAVGDTVYAAGHFSTQGPGLVAFDGRSGALEDWHPALGAPIVVDALAAANDSLYVGGIDVTAAGPLARLDAKDGHRLPFNPRIVGIYYRPGSVDALLITAAGLYVAGPFRSVGGKQRNGIALLDPRTARVKPWTLPSCDPPDPDTDYNPARVLVAIEDRIVTNCRAFGEGERLVVARGPSR
jgi:hypothetical protein